MRLLYPSSLLRATLVDEFFSGEAAAASVRPALYDAASSRVLSRGVDVAGEVLVYRGWILSPGEYATMESVVTAAGASLLVGSSAYDSAQFFGGWFDVFSAVTPASVVLPFDADDDSLLAAASDLVASTGEARMVVKGGSKSVKEDWFNAMFVSSVGDLLRVLSNFRAAVSSGSESSLVLRSFEEWSDVQLRLWWVDGVLTFVGPHPQSAVDGGWADVCAEGWTGDSVSTADSAASLAGHSSALAAFPGLASFVSVLSPLVSVLSNPLLVTDVVVDVNGGWRVVEVGDGGVSSCPVPFGVAVADSPLGVLF